MLCYIDREQRFSLLGTFVTLDCSLAPTTTCQNDGHTRTRPVLLCIRAMIVQCEGNVGHPSAFEVLILAMTSFLVVCDLFFGARFLPELQ